MTPPRARPRVPTRPLSKRSTSARTRAMPNVSHRATRGATCTFRAATPPRRYPMAMTPQERVQAALVTLGLPGKVREFAASTGTARDAANAVGCELGQIVKTLFFLADGRPTMALVAGDRQADTARLAEVVGVGRKKL